MDEDALELVKITLVPAGFLVTLCNLVDDEEIRLPIIQLLRNIISELEGSEVTQSIVSNLDGTPLGTLYNVTRGKLN